MSMAARGANERVGGQADSVPTTPTTLHMRWRASRKRAFAYPTMLCRRPLRLREHHPVIRPAVAVREHAADRVIAVHVHAHGVTIPQFVADVEIDAFAHDELSVIHVDGFPNLALHRPWRVGKSRHG